MSKAKVAILKTRPETAIDDYIRLFELSGRVFRSEHEKQSKSCPYPLDQLVTGRSHGRPGRRARPQRGGLHRRHDPPAPARPVTRKPARQHRLIHPV